MNKFVISPDALNRFRNAASQVARGVASPVSRWLPVKDGHFGASQKRAEELGTKTNARFEHEERHHQLAQRQAQIEEKLDLTKNQAPSQVESEEPEQNVEQNTVNQKAERPAPRVRQSAIRV